MPKLLQIDFPYVGPYGDEMADAFESLAESIAAEPGFRWKIWTESRERCEAGGIYLFDDQASADAYLQKQTERLRGFGIENIRARVFDVNARLNRITKGPA